MTHIKEYLKLLKQCRSLIISTLLFVMVIGTYFTLTRAWFVSPRDNQATGINLSVKSFDPKTFTIYRLEQDDSGDITVNGVKYSWVDARNRIDLTAYSSNEVHRYKLVCDSSEITKLSFNITSASTPDTVNDGDTKTSYFDFLYFKPTDETDLFTDYTGVSTTNTFNEQAAVAGHGSVNASGLVENIVYDITLNDQNECIFDMYIHKDLCNMYSGWSFTGTATVE